MFVSGRLSLRIVCPFVNVAAPDPVFAADTVQFQLFPSVVAPLTLFVFVAVRSGAVTVTESLHRLLPSSLSVMRVPGSAAQPPPARGLANEPTALGVAVNWAPNVPVLAAMITMPPLA